MQPGPIGVFDSGYGGLTICTAAVSCCPIMIISISETMRGPRMVLVRSRLCINLRAKPC